MNFDKANDYLEKVEYYLEKKYNADVMRSGVWRICYIALAAKQKRYTQTKNLVRDAYEYFRAIEGRHDVTYSAFERSVYREFKRMHPEDYVTEIITYAREIAKAV